MKQEDDRLVLAGDPETGEIYAARVVDEKQRGHGRETQPLVRICRVVRYPHQRAIQMPDVALEMPALSDGLVCRMNILRELSGEEQAAFLATTYRGSLRAAQKEALKTARTEKERQIIRRHLDGEYLRQRRVKSYGPTEIRLLKSGYLNTEEK